MRPTTLRFTLPDRYRLEGPVASGGMAAVYAAHDTLLDRPVAVKVLAEHLNEDVAARERFKREARAAAGLSSHPGVVTIFDVGEHEGRSFIVMELFRGGTIADVLRSGRRPDPTQALRWLRQAAEALDAAHERGIVHRDIKPGNLLLDEHGNLGVADFGIARLAWEEAVTQTGQVLGTAAYISPEQAQGAQATHASDRYALAVVAYELLTGTRPFEGEHFAAQARAHIEDDPPPASVRNPSLPRAVDGVLRRGLAKDPAARWPSAVAFVEALERAAGGDLEETAATRVMGDGAGGAPSAPETRRAVAPAPAPAARPVRSGTRLPVMLGLVLIAIGLVALLLAISGGGGEERSGQLPEALQEAPEDRQPDERQPPAEEQPPAEDAPGADAGQEPSIGDAARLNDEGFQLFQQGKYADAVPIFRQAVDACGDSKDVDPCGYALFNLGASLNRSGQPAEAIPILRQRLERFPEDQRDVVLDELASACEAAGQECPEVAGEGGDDDDGGGNGKGKGKGKKD